jgi:CDP-4-dehydro-6-deoxyglucose reductase, E3
MSAREYTVRIDPHRREIQARDDRPVLEAAFDAGLNLPHSCKSGHCGSCRARLVSGEIHYPNGRPLGLMAEEAAAGYVLLCQALPRSDLKIEARLIANVAEVEIKTLPCRIARLERLAPDVMQVFLKLPSVEALRFQPGQYLDVLLDDGRRRSFSLANPPHDNELIELHVRRVMGGGFSELLFTTLQVGSLLRIEGPVGQFVYRESEAPLLMIAGGTGFAPLKSMLRHMLERGVRRETHLYWGARQAVDVYEEALVRSCVRQQTWLHFNAVLSDSSAPSSRRKPGSSSGKSLSLDPGLRRGDEHGHDYRFGWVHEVALADHPDLSAFDVYVAGPPALVEAVRASFPARGASRLYFDSFDYAPPTTAS